ncbi:MAG: hypothetical protein NXI01_09130 [Gammaproteobacteria bacterium]|nr:hypothetical protein [Gammaproteobacteria bacterium]
MAKTPPKKTGTNAEKSAVQGLKEKAFSKYQKATELPFGARTAIKAAKTTPGAIVGSAVANASGFPATPAQVKMGATAADKALDVKEKVDKNIADNIKSTATKPKP